MLWTLVLLVYSGPLASGDNVALTNVTGFETMQACTSAGEASVKALTSSTRKSGRYICVSVKK